MTAGPVYAPYVPEYASTEPYITAEEFLAAPTGTDTTQLLPGGSPNANRDALAGVIQRASSYADVYCRQVLAATRDVQPAPPQGWRVQVPSSGRALIRVPVDYTPVLQVDEVWVGQSPSDVARMTDLTGLWISRKVISVPVSGTSNMAVGANGYWPSSPNRMFGYVRYVNGWANATLGAAALAGATSIVPTDVLGIYPGLGITVYDGLYARTEKVVVASTYVPGTATVDLVAPLAHDHAAGVAVSALPPAVRQAVISLTSSLIKRRGGESLVLAALGESPQRKTMGEPGVVSDVEVAMQLLLPFRRAR